MLRYTTDRARPGLVALYDIWPGNGEDQFLQPQSPHGALVTRSRQVHCGWKYALQVNLMLAEWVLLMQVQTASQMSLFFCCYVTIVHLQTLYCSKLNLNHLIIVFRWRMDKKLSRQLVNTSNKYTIDIINHIIYYYFIIIQNIGPTKYDV